MQSDIFDTPFENMLRVLLLLSEAPNRPNVDRIAAIDFISIYGKSFGMLDSDLHGVNRFNFAEFTRKREMISKAIDLAVANDLIDIGRTPDGLVFGINDRGRKLLDGTISSYAISYLSGLKEIICKLWKREDIELLEFINRKAKASESRSLC